MNVYQICSNYFCWFLICLSRTLRTFCNQQLTRFQQYSQKSLDWPSMKMFQINLYRPPPPTPPPPKKKKNNQQRAGSDIYICRKLWKYPSTRLKKICFPDEQSRAIMTLYYKLNMFFFFCFFFFCSFCQSPWPVLHFAYSLSKMCMVGKDFSNTGIVYKLTHKNYMLYIYMLNCFS